MAVVLWVMPDHNDTSKRAIPLDDRSLSADPQSHKFTLPDGDSKMSSR